MLRMMVLFLSFFGILCGGALFISVEYTPEIGAARLESWCFWCSG